MDSNNPKILTPIPSQLKGADEIMPFSQSDAACTIRPTARSILRHMSSTILNLEDNNFFLILYERGLTLRHDKNNVDMAWPPIGNGVQFRGGLNEHNIFSMQSCVYLCPTFSLILV